jgi:hypothetical protein
MAKATRMKKCSHCGREFPDTATVCDIDGRPLVDSNPPDRSSQTLRAPKEYQRLPGRGTQVEGGRWFAITSSLCTVWMARDHLLLVSRIGYTETYKRFYFRDIQAIIIRKTATAFVWNIVLSIVALGFILPAVGVSDATAKIVLALIAGFFTFLVLWSLWRGSSCVTHIKTAVQTEQLAAWNRMRAARKGMALIRPRLLEAQGEFPQAELRARLEEQILRQTQASSAETP